MTTDKIRKYHREYYHRNKNRENTAIKRDANGRFQQQIDLQQYIPKIISLYTIDKKSTCYIGKLFNVDKTIISRILKSNNIKLRSNTITHKMSGQSKHSKWTGYEEISGSYWRSVINGATKARNLTFNITIEQVWEKYVHQNKKCALTGIPLVFAQFNKDFVSGKQTASLDRINSDIGYEINNVWWVHKRINMMKKEMSVEEFQYFCEQVSKYKKDKNENK